MDSLWSHHTESVEALWFIGSLGRRSRLLIHFLMPNWYWPVSSGLTWFTWTHSREKMIPLVYMAEALDDAICCVGGVLLQDGGGSQIDRRGLAGLFFTLTTNPLRLCHCLPQTRGKSVWKLTPSNWLASVSLSSKYLWPSLMLFFFYSESLFSFLLL